MSDGKSHETGAWAAVGKIAVLVTAVMGIIQIGQYLFAKDAKLSAEGDYHAFSLPRQLGEGIKKLREIDEDEVAKYLPENLAAKESIASAVARGLRDTRSVEFFDDISGLGTYMKLNIRNDGEREAKDVTLDLESKCFYKLSRNGEDDVVGFVNGGVPIGTLRPAKSVSVQVWSDHMIFEGEPPRPVRLTYPEGSAFVSFPSRITGLTQILYEWSELIIFVLCVIGFLPFLNWMQSVIDRSMDRQTSRITATQQAPSADRPDKGIEKPPK